MRYIDADKLLNSLPEDLPYKASVKRVLIQAPSADVEEVRHGMWVKQKADPEAMKIIHDMGLGKGMSINSIYWTCSVCENWGTPAHKYCCSCGAVMDVERKEQNEG